MRAQLKILTSHWVGSYASTSSWQAGGVALQSDGEGRLRAPSQVAIHSAGDFVYIADWGGNRIHKYRLSTGAFVGWLGKLTSTGGTCTAGVNQFTGGWCAGGTLGSGTGDGMFSQPYSIAIDPTNDFLYVGDSINHRVQKFVLSTGAFVGWIGKIATTGGSCTAGVNQFTGGWCSGGTSGSGNGDGMFNWIKGIAIDVSGDALYVSEYSNHRIQKFVLSTGAFVGWIGKIATTGGTCLAGVNQFTGGWCSGGTSGSGNGNGMMNSPTDVFVDTANNFLYVADTLNYRIQKFILSTGAFVGWIGGIGTTGGTCTAGTNVYTGGWCSGGTSALGSSDGMFRQPLSLAVDRINNHLYVTDSGIVSVQKYNLTTGAFVGWIGTVGSPGGSCTASIGSYTGGWCNGGTLTIGSSNGSFSNVAGVTLDVTNNLMFISDAGQVNKYVLSSGSYISSIGSFAMPRPGWNQGLISEYNYDGNGGFGWPQGIAIDATNDHFYVADADGSNVSKFSFSTGNFVSWIGEINEIGGTCTAGVGQPTGGWCSGGSPSEGYLDGEFSGPYSIAVDRVNNFLYVVDSYNHRIKKFNLSTGAFVSWIGGVDSPAGTCMGSYVYSGAWCSGAYSASGNTNGMMNNPQGIAIDISGDALYVADTSNHRIQKFVLSTGAFVGWIGKILATGGTCTAGVNQFTGGWCSGGSSASGIGDGMFNEPVGIVIDTANNALFVADKNNHRIQKFVLSTGAFVGWVGKLATSSGTCTAAPNQFTGGWCSGGTSGSGNSDGMFNSPEGIAIDVNQNAFYVTDTSNHRVQKFTLSTGAFVGWIGQIGTSGGTCTGAVGTTTRNWCSGGTAAQGKQDGAFSNPRGIAVHPNGRVLLISEDYRVQKLTLPW